MKTAVNYITPKSLTFNELDSITDVKLRETWNGLAEFDHCANHRLQTLAHIVEQFLPVICVQSGGDVNIIILVVRQLRELAKHLRLQSAGFL